MITLTVLAGYFLIWQLYFFAVGVAFASRSNITKIKISYMPGTVSLIFALTAVNFSLF